MSNCPLSLHNTNFKLGSSDAKLEAWIDETLVPTFKSDIDHPDEPTLRAGLVWIVRRTITNSKREVKSEVKTDTGPWSNKTRSESTAPSMSEAANKEVHIVFQPEYTASH